MIANTDKQINELIFRDYIKHNDKLAHFVYERLVVDAAHAQLYPQLFNELLRVEWAKYCMNN